MLAKILQKSALAAFCGSFILAAPALAAQPAAKTAAAQSAVSVQNAWARPMPPAAKVGAGYFEMRNNGKTALRFIAAESDIAEKVEIHSMAMEGNVMKMRHLGDGIEIAPHGRLSFAPGAYHLMFINPKAPFKAGQVFSVRFKFANGETLAAPFAVRGEKAAAKAAPHSARRSASGQ